MTLIEHLLVQARSGLADIHRDRDRALSFVARYGGSPALDVWIEQLELERAQHLLLIKGIAELRLEDHPALQHDVRVTRMAKASLRSVRADRARTGTDR